MPQTCVPVQGDDIDRPWEGDGGIRKASGERCQEWWEGARSEEGIGAGWAGVAGRSKGAPKGGNMTDGRTDVGLDRGKMRGSMHVPAAATADFLHT